MNNPNLTNILLEQKKERDYLLTKKLIPREITVSIRKDLDSSLIKVITGPRRAGKSSVALEILKYKTFAYINFEDDNISEDVNTNLLFKTLETIYGSPKYYFFDEIQLLNNWEQFVNKLHRRGKNLIITGSNSKLLSSELASGLTGRYIEYKVFPFSYPEYLNSNNKIQNRSQSLNSIDNYLSKGGYPEVILENVESKNYLSTLLDSIVLKDIIKRYKIRNISGINNLTSLMISNVCSKFSGRSFEKSLKNELSIATITKYIGYMNEAFLFFELNNFSYKPKLRVTSDRKLYVIDNGFINSRSVTNSLDLSKYLENFVFIELYRRGSIPNLNLFYYKTQNNYEVDFYIHSNQQQSTCIQVCYDLSSIKTSEREFRALVTAKKELNVKNLIVITYDTSKVIQYDDEVIECIGLKDWLI